jgi:PAS domain S-box-containing protein
VIHRITLFAAWLILVGGLFGVNPARAVEAVNVPLNTPALDLTAATQQFKTEVDRIQVSTAPGADGIVRRVEVRAREHNNYWAVFALTNNSDEQIDRLIVVPHYRMVGSGLLRPDLGISRVVAITPSFGDHPLRHESTTADIFQITLDPGTVITFVAELRTDNLPQIYLWEPDAYKDKVNSFTLYYGIVIGIAGLLALFLTILFVVKGSIMFPAAAALSWAVLIYIGIDFGFWGKVFDTTAGAERVWRACGEAILSATLLVFLFAYLNLSRWHVRYAHITIGWLAALAALIAVAVFEPGIAAGIARLSLAGIAVFGFALVIYLSTHGFDRAVLLIPTWLLLVVWTATAGFAVTGFVTNDIIGPALLGGLVLVVMLIGFTVMQHAFAGGITHGIVSDVERRALALTGAGDMIWDWDVSADKIYTSPETEQLLGIKRGVLEGPAASWLNVLHPLDRDRFRTSLDTVVEHRRGHLTQDFRLRAIDGRYVWVSLKARPVAGSDGEVVRLVGTMTNVSDSKNAEERMLFDAIHDGLTGLPNRELFLDRVKIAFAFTQVRISSASSE